MKIDPEQILVGAGTDFLYNILVQLLGRDKIYALEEPGYDKTRHIYTAAGARCVSAFMDEAGVLPEGLGEAGVLHISPSHHFPTGIVTPVSRRLELLAWAEAAEDRWIIEDDYDSEFRFHSHPMPAMHSLDRQGRVIYLNTFSKSLAPSIRISYMVLPESLMERFRRELGFYSCTVPSFEQYTLARFIAGGWFEKHINRMRKYYRTSRNRLVQRLENGMFAHALTILEKDAGLHFLVKVDTAMTEEALVEWCAQRGVKVRTLSSYYHGPVPEQDAGLHFLVKVDTALSDRELTQALARSGIRIQALSDYYHAPTDNQHMLVVNYAGLEEGVFREALAQLDAGL
jgi:GntR family transcriptional regulator/MocR family aminotransferase